MTIYPENTVIMAPLSGYTDVPYRHSLRRHGCNYAFTEMIDTGSLVYAKGRTRNFLDRAEDEEWLGVQIVGNRIDEIKKAVEIINTRDFSVLDLNIGCPTPKVAKKGKGAGLARDIDYAAKIIEAMVKKSHFPVTAKIRIQDINDPSPTVDFIKKLENAGLQAVTVHGRLMKSIYSGPCYTDIIKAVKENVRMPVVANGGVMNYQDYKDIMNRSGCSRIMIARGAMGNPWIFEELTTGIKRYISTEELCDEMQKHISEIAEYYEEITAMKLSRKIILDYLQGRGFPRKLKCEVSQIRTLDDFKRFMLKVKEGPSRRFLEEMGKI
ncbi:MAG: tRNA-dihydrouridine synthase family protein [Victivallales bacterium]|nr:tRNA-dihydrouridine synthase family protein [Victivallales bacterium]MCF7889231.1 tRNA-dihydrouridine synthase family protein [Victivallales bacterium]